MIGLEVHCLKERMLKDKVVLLIKFTNRGKTTYSVAWSYYDSVTNKPLKSEGVLYYKTLKEAIIKFDSFK